MSAALSRQARSAAAGSGFMRAKRRESLLAHTTLPVPEAQRRSPTVAPGSANALFNEGILAEVVEQVQRSSQVSSNLAVSRSLGRGRSAPSSSSPLTGPRSSSAPRGRPYGKRSSSSSRSGGRKRFKGSKGAAPSVCHHSQSPREAPGISGDGAHPSGSALGSAPLVCRSPPAVAGPSGHPSGSYRPPAPASLSAPLPGSPQATTSCLETPEVHQSCRILLSSSGAVLFGALAILACRVPAPLVSLPFMVPFSWTLCVSSFVGEGG